MATDDVSRRRSNEGQNKKKEIIVKKQNVSSAESTIGTAKAHLFRFVPAMAVTAFIALIMQVSATSTQAFLAGDLNAASDDLVPDFAPLMGDPSGNTAEGDKASQSLTTGGSSSFVGGLAIAPPARADFNSDGYTDFLLQNSSMRQTVVWYLHNNAFSSSASALILPADWSIAYVADINLDAKPDYILVNVATLRTAVWYLNGTAFITSAFGPRLPSGWTLVAAVDMNNDGWPDYVLFNDTTRQTAVWFLSGTAFVSAAFGPTLPDRWRLVDANDFNNDGQMDFLISRLVLSFPFIRRTGVWYLSGTEFAGASVGPPLPTHWSIAGTADFNRDGKPDYALSDYTTGQTAIWYLNGGTRIGAAYGPTVPAPWSLVFP